MLNKSEDQKEAFKIQSQIQPLLPTHSLSLYLSIATATDQHLPPPTCDVMHSQALLLKPMAQAQPSVQGQGAHAQYCHAASTSSATLLPTHCPFRTYKLGIWSYEKVNLISLSQTRRCNKVHFVSGQTLLPDFRAAMSEEKALANGQGNQYSRKSRCQDFAVCMWDI